MNPSTAFLTFIEGILAFISPCIFPLLPVYIVYLAGSTQNTDKKKLTINTLGFILGFTIIFILLGATATSLGNLLHNNKFLLQRIGGAIIIMFGLNLLNVFKPVFLNRERRFTLKVNHSTFSGSVLFGMVFSLGWTPCLGAFLGSALFMASNANTVVSGITLLFIFSLGLGVPFLITAVIFDKLTNVFTWIKKKYQIINLVSGMFLVIVGLLMLFNLFGYYSRLFYF